LAGGIRTIDASFGVGWGWYSSNRYHSVDIPFLNRFRKVLIDRPDLGIELDFDKTAVTIPVIEYTVHHGTTNPFNGADFTAVEPGGIAIETPLAAKRSPIDPATSLRLYKNVDIHTADNSKGSLVARGAIAPGDAGAQPIPDTVVGWILARSDRAGIDLPSLPATHDSCAE
jgi:hypothetical protein